MKWNTKRLNQPFTWYSGDVIEKIKKHAQCSKCCNLENENICRDCGGYQLYAIRRIIENEDK